MINKDERIKNSNQIDVKAFQTCSQENKSIAKFQGQVAITISTIKHKDLELRSH